MITPREIQRWYPKRWCEIAGNSQIKQTWSDLIHHGGTNTVCTGPNRSGKTRGTALGITATLCLNRSPQLDPCYRCGPCRQINNARESLNGLFSVIADANASYFAVDCESVTPEELKMLARDVRMESVGTYVYLDEVSALGRRGLEGLLLKAIDETAAIWIATAIAVRRRGGKLKRAEGLSDPMLARFAVKVGTTLPREPELTTWIIDRCCEWEITIIQPETAIPLLIKRSRHRVGMVILFLAAAASKGRWFGPDEVNGFDFQAQD